MTAYLKSNQIKKKDHNAIFTEKKNPLTDIFEKIEDGKEIEDSEARRIIAGMSKYLHKLGITNIKVSSKNPLKAIEDMG